MATIEQAFSNVKLTENGDITYSSTGNHLLDLLFMTEYYNGHLDEVNIGTSDREKLFSMFVRDPRYGLGKRDLGRRLMSLSNCPLSEMVKAGRWDDVIGAEGWMDFMAGEIKAGNELAKKWAPRYSSKNLLVAREFASHLGMNKQQYGKFVKANTVERSLSSKNTGIINFSQVPSLAMIKYYNRFSRGEDTSKRFAKYLEDVRDGKAELKVATTSVYDIYRNREQIDPDLFFDKIEKISINCIPIVDTSGSMNNANDSFGKAMAIGHYLAKCSTFMPDTVVSFSSFPQLLTLGKSNFLRESWRGDRIMQEIPNTDSRYLREIASMYTGDCSSTDFGAVMDLFRNVTELPEYLVVLSDMEFDMGSKMSKDAVKALWEQKGYTTKIVWWNLNERSTTSPEIDAEGNIFMSGYNPMLLKFLEAGFDGQKFLDRLLDEYAKKISER